MTIYQIAEALGQTAEQVRDTLTPAELCEWGVYLNSPFSAKGRDTLMNGWLVHVVRSMMADKRHRPKFSESVFPFDKLAKEFFAAAKTAKTAVKAVPVADGKPKTVGEVAHLSQVISKRYEQALADYRAGRTPNKAGLYIGERLRK